MPEFGTPLRMKSRICSIERFRTWRLDARAGPRSVPRASDPWQPAQWVEKSLRPLAKRAVVVSPELWANTRMGLKTKPPIINVRCHILIVTTGSPSNGEWDHRDGGDCP